MPSFLLSVTRLMTACLIASIVNSKPHHDAFAPKHGVAHRHPARDAPPVNDGNVTAAAVMKQDVTCVTDEIATILSTQPGASSFCNYYTGAEQETTFVYTTPTVTRTYVTATIQETEIRYLQTTCAYTTTVPAKHKRQPQITPLAKYRRDTNPDDLVGVIVEEIISRNDSISPASSLFASVASALYSACTCANYSNPAPTTITTNGTALTTSIFAHVVKGDKITTTETICIVNQTVTVVATASSGFAFAASTVAVIPIPSPTPVTAVGIDVQCPRDNNTQTHVLIGSVLYAWRVLCDVDTTDNDISSSQVLSAGDCEAACGSINDAVKSPLCAGWVYTESQTAPYNCFSKASVGNRIPRPGSISGVLEIVQVAPNTTFSNETSTGTDVSPIVSAVVNNNNTLVPPQWSCSGATSGFGTTAASTWTDSAGLIHWTSYYTWSSNWFEACYTTWKTVLTTTYSAVYATSTSGAGSGTGSGNGDSGSNSGGNAAGGVISGSAAAGATVTGTPMVTATSVSGGNHSGWGNGGWGNGTGYKSVWESTFVSSGSTYTITFTNWIGGGATGGHGAGRGASAVATQAGGQSGGGANGGNFTVVTVINGTVITSVLATNVSGMTASGSQGFGILPMFLTPSDQAQLSTTTLVTNQSTYVTVVTIQASGGSAGGSALGGILTPTPTLVTVSSNVSLVGSEAFSSSGGFNATALATGGILSAPISSGASFANKSFEASVLSSMENENTAGGSGTGGVITPPAPSGTLLAPTGSGVDMTRTPMNTTLWSNETTIPAVAYPTPPPGNNYYLPPPFSPPTARPSNSSYSAVAGETLNTTAPIWINTTSTAYDYTALPIAFETSKSSYSPASSQCPCLSATPTVTVTESCLGTKTTTIYETIYATSCFSGMNQDSLSPSPTSNFAFSTPHW